MEDNQKEYNKQWRKDNPDKVKAYREAHKKEIKAYHDAHKKEKKECSKAWRESNKDKVKAYNQTHKKEIAASYKKWRKDNADKKRGYSRKHTALKHTTQVEPINEKLVYLRDGWKCQICHKRVDKRFKHPNPMSASMDHIIPLSKNGTHTYANVQLAHFTCNISKHVSVLPQGEQMRIF